MEAKRDTIANAPTSRSSGSGRATPMNKHMKSPVEPPPMDRAKSMASIPSSVILDHLEILADEIKELKAMNQAQSQAMAQQAASPRQQAAESPAGKKGRKEPRKVSTLAVAVEAPVSAGGAADVASFDGGVSTPRPRVAVMDDGGDDEMLLLCVGDLVTLRLNAVGLVVGDMQLNRLGAEAMDAREGGQRKGTRGAFTPADYAFRVCPKLSYRAKAEDQLLRKRRTARAPSVFSKQEAAADASASEDCEDDDGGGDGGGGGADMSLLKTRVKIEHEHNAEVLAQLEQGRSSGPILFGDVIQLQHVRSGRFVGMRKSPAPCKVSNKCVVLMDDGEAGSACHFKIMPRFKVRAKGAPVYSMDEVFLESCDFAGYLLSGTPGFAYTGAIDRADCHLKRCIQVPRAIEINGFLRNNNDKEKAEISFQVRLFSRAVGGGDLTTLQSFRLFHGEFNGYLGASSDRDKGDVLDIAPGDRLTVARRKRVGGLPAHIPFLKKLAVSGDPGNSANLSAKAVWRFEPLEENTASVVQFGVALRIVHAATNKYLSVNCFKPGVLTPDSSREASGNDDAVEFYDCALVDAHEVDPSTLLFTMVPTTVVAGATLKNMNTKVRVEHRTRDGQRLFMTDVDDIKPPFKDKAAQATVNAPKSRMGFTTRTTGLEVHTIVPVSAGEGALLDQLLGIVPIVELYTHRFKTAESDADLPTDMCEAMVYLLLLLIDRLVKGKIRALSDGRKSTAEFIDDAVSSSASHLAELFGGDPNRSVQMACYEIKLLDAVFECTLAPYSRVRFHNDSGRGPFTSKTTQRGPAAVQKYLYVCLERMVADNQAIIGYFASRRSRVWKAGNERVSDEWRNLTVDQSDDESGAAVLLSLLFSTSADVLVKLVDDTLLERFKSLIRNCGPQRRLINLFASICFVEGSPMRFYQESCVRLLWISEKDRYDIMATFHDLSAEASAKGLASAGIKEPFAQLSHPDGTPCHEHCRAFGSGAPAEFLGRTADNAYAPVGVVWRSSLAEPWGQTEGKDDRGGLFWSPALLGLPTAGPFNGVGGARIGDLVPVEQLFWVLEPKRLSKAVTGRTFKPFEGAEREGFIGSDKDGTGRNSAEPKRASISVRLKSSEAADRSVEYAQFARKVALAEYIVDEVLLLTAVCRGRSYNSIHWLEKSFSYDLLLNMASNQRLPHVLRAAVVTLTLALYVDRFPQSANCGAPCLPEALWVLHDDSSSPPATKDAALSTPPRRASLRSVLLRNAGKLSTLPSVKLGMVLEDPEAFPEFFIPTLSSAAGKKDPVISMPLDSKFYLLSDLANTELLRTGGKVVHVDTNDKSQGLNKFISALLQSQKALLDFGFSSNITAVSELVQSFAEILDGRNDVHTPKELFDPPEARFLGMGQHSVAVTSIKKSIVGSLGVVGVLRSNYRLGLLLGHFRHAIESGKDVDAWARSKDAFKCFEGLFEPRGPKAYIKDSAGLSFEALAKKSDWNDSLIDLIMYDNDDLMAKTLGLMESSFRQRNDLVLALQNVLLVEDTKLPVYHDMHTLRNDLDDLWELVSTHAVWGVRSLVSGDFSDEKFGRLMRMVDMLIEFIYTPTPTGTSAASDGTATVNSPLELERSASLDRGPKDAEAAEAAPAATRALKDEATSYSKGGDKSKGKALTAKATVARPSTVKQGGKPPAALEPVAPLTPSSGQGNLVQLIIEALESMYPGVPADLRVLSFFQRVDVDRDGYLGVNELRRSFREVLGLAGKMNDGDVSAMLGDMVEEGETEVNAATFANYLRAQADKINYRGSFKDIDADQPNGFGASGVTSWAGRCYESKRIWSTDVADKWLAKVRKNGLVTNKAHQEILRACNLQQLLGSALAMDPDTAFTGQAECTLAQKVESRRRISLMLRAMLVLLKAFVVDNGANQSLAFDLLGALQKVATPDDLRPASSTARSGITDAHRACYSCTAAPGAKEAAGVCQWPRTMAETAQDVIVAVFRSNEAMCLRLGETTDRHPLFDLFAHVAHSFAATSGDDSGDGGGVGGGRSVEDAPALDFFFVVMSPTSLRPLAELQSHTASVLVDPAYPALVAAARGCVDRAVASSRASSKSDEASVDPWAFREHGKIMDHWRMVRLLKCAVQQGNHWAMATLANGLTGTVDLDTVCGALTKVIASRTGATALLLDDGAGHGDVEDPVVTWPEGDAILSILLNPLLLPPSHANDAAASGRRMAGAFGGIALSPPPSHKPAPASTPTMCVAFAAALRAGVDPVSACEEALTVANFDDPRPRSGPCDLLSLAVELFDLLPLSEEQALSPVMWRCCEVLEPALGAIAQQAQRKDTGMGKGKGQGSKKGNGAAWLSDAERVCLRDLVDLFSRLLAKVDELDMVRHVVRDQLRDQSFVVVNVKAHFEAIRSSEALLCFVSPRTLEAMDRAIAFADLRGEEAASMVVHSRKDAHTYFDLPGFRPRAVSVGIKGRSGGGDDNLRKVPNGATPASSEISFHAAVAAFKDGVAANEFIGNSIKLRRFFLLELLENGSPGKSDKYRGAVRVTWEMIVTRLVRYANNYALGLARSPGSEGSAQSASDHACVLIFTILRDHLEKCRTFPIDDKGRINRDPKTGKRSAYQHATGELCSGVVVRDASELDPLDAQELTQNQMHLLKAGSVELMARVLMNRDGAEAGQLADEALCFLIEMLQGGNTEVQELLFKVVKGDTEGRFLAHLAAKLDASMEAMSEGKRFGLMGAAVDSNRLSSELEYALGSAQKVTAFLCLLCEGHFSGFQNLLREQPLYSAATFDFVGELVYLLCQVADSHAAVTTFGASERELVASLLLCLTEMVQGPCEANIKAVASSDVVVALNAIFVAAPNPMEATAALQDPSYESLVDIGCELVASVFEGVKERATMAHFVQHLDMRPLYGVACRLDQRVRQAREDAHKANIPLHGDAKARCGVMLQTLAHVWNIQLALFPDVPRERSARLLAGLEQPAGSKSSTRPTARPPRPSLNERGASGHQKALSGRASVAATSPREGFAQQASPLAHKPLIGVVEVAWEGRTRQVCFPIPAAMKYLSESAKAAFLKRTRLETTEKRLLLMVESMEDFEAEMGWVQRIAERSAFYRKVGKYYTVLTNGAYACVVLLNVNVVFAPPALRRPLAAASAHWGALRESDGGGAALGDQLSPSDFASLCVTFGIGFVVLALYAVLTGYHASTTVPILAFKVDRHKERALAGGLTRKGFKRWGAFRGWLQALSFSACFVVIHALNFPLLVEASLPLYSALAFLFVPWALICWRRCLVIPDSSFDRVFIVAFDTCAGPSLRTLVLLLGVGVRGFYDASFFTLMLLEVFSVSEQLANVMASVAMRANALSLILYVFVISSVATASFGLQMFPDAFRASDGEKVVEFKSVLAAFWFLLHKLPMRGSMGQILDPVLPKSSDWIARVFFDTGIFIWLGIILSTAVTALLVDAMQSMRHDATMHEAAGRHRCFVCGLERTAYDDLGLDGSLPSFDAHCALEHSPWDYVAYLSYVTTKHRDRWSGTETFVNAMIAADGPWTPHASSCALEAAGKLKPPGRSASSSGGQRTATHAKGDASQLGDAKGDADEGDRALRDMAKEVRDLTKEVVALKKLVAN